MQKISGTSKKGRLSSIPRLGSFSKGCRREQPEKKPSRLLRRKGEKHLSVLVWRVAKESRKESSVEIRSGDTVRVKELLAE